YFFFFFSSRRRHTRSKRDWSSDVCSSDLTTLTPRSAPMCFVIWPDWPWPSPSLDPPARPPPPTPSERPDAAPVSHPHPSVPQKRPTNLAGRSDNFRLRYRLLPVGPLPQHTRRKWRGSRSRISWITSVRRCD